nr:olfactory receptor 19 [Tropidothorax elegans]
MKNKNVQKERVHNFLEERKWILNLSGASVLDNWPYRLYLLFIYAFELYGFFACVMTLMYVSGEKELTIRVIHMIILSYFVLGVLSSRIYGNRSLLEAASLLKAGIYQGEVFDEEVTKVVEDAVQLVKKISNGFAYSCWVCVTLNLVVHPLTYFLFRYDRGDHQSPVKPFLPYPYYMPFDTSSFVGFSAAYLVTFIATVIIFGNATTSTDMYMSCVTQTTAQLKILNLSLRCLSKRALVLYQREVHDILDTVDAPGILRKDIINRCMVQCLKENIKHHQTIIRYRNAYTKYVSCSMFASMTCGSLAYAAHIFLILQKLGPGMTFIYFFDGCAELMYNFIINYQGEEVLQESSALFESLYATPWLEGNKEFRQMIEVMMAYTLNPPKIKTAIFNISASLESFGDMVSGIYKLMSVLSNF